MVLNFYPVICENKKEYYKLLYNLSLSYGAGVIFCCLKTLKTELNKNFEKWILEIKGSIFEIIEENKLWGYQNQVDLGDSFKVSRTEFKKLKK